MKLVLLIVESGKPPAWVEAARADYAGKVSGFFPLEIKILKSPGVDRDSAAVKTRREAELILGALDERDLLVLFDEGGKQFKNSDEFSGALTRVVESGKGRAVFCIGGPYGFDESVRSRAQNKWSLSGLTFNHWVASVAGLEQLYRGFTIIKGIPYHNR
jgi:23S rRNA (pseudouridine1915-N3)-methyltransferase